MRSEIAHDWTHYNRWVDKASNQIGRADPRQVSPIDWWTIAKAAALCLVAVGLAVALMLWAWREPKVVVPDVKVQVEQPLVQLPLPPVVEQPVRDQASKIIRNYVLFTERAMPGVGTVVTGWKFDSQNNPRPIEQWCYLSPLYGEEIGTMQRIDLPRFSATTASTAALRRHQLTSVDVEKARRDCVWFQG